MSYTVSVRFDEGQVYEFKLHDGDLAGSTPESARRWLERQFNDMGCEPTNPTGKTLLVDRILGVARAMGDTPFAQNDKSAQEFARNAILAMERKVISVNVAALSVG